MRSNIEAGIPNHSLGEGWWGMELWWRQGREELLVLASVQEKKLEEGSDGLGLKVALNALASSCLFEF